MEQQHRLHSLDAVRAFALLFGIVFHATMSFVPAVATLGWPLIDNSPSSTLSVTFYVLHIFRMTTFFVIAGFFARLVVYRKGVPAFVTDRRKRILIPLLVSWPVQISLIGAAIIWGATRGGKPLAPPPPTGEHILVPFAWTHLWFLYVLLLLYVVILVTRWLANTAVDRESGIRHAVDRAIAMLTNIPLAPIFLAIPVGVSLYMTEWWNFWIGIPTPDNSIIPNLAAFVGYGTAITFGWFLHRQAHLLQTFERYWLGYFVAAIVLTVMCYSLVGMPTTPIYLDATLRAIYSAAYSLAIWCWTFAVIGAAIKFLSGESTVRRYLADASYWMYIMHMPIVAALQALMMQWHPHWTLKYSLILVITFTVLLITYHYWVRPTKIGEVLNGRRYSIAKAQTELHQLGR
jgi:glucan biosynthesis protein C